ncbi:MAG TPA: hypothetical protein QGF02_01555 [Candidatus Babeliales bacterium]|nr:hypothetical protein [Candidatus Babeliales bacterium]
MTKKLKTFLLALFISLPIISMDDYFDDDFGWDEFSMEADEKGDCFSDIGERPCVLSPSNILSAIGIVNGLPLALVDALKLTVYLHTNTPVTRYICDQPIFIKYNNGQSFLNASIFLNWMNEMHFAEDSTHINSYLTLSKENTLRVLGQFSSITGVDLIKVVRLFENFTLREAKLGLMLQGRQQFDCGVYAGFQVPLYYFIRHYNATAQEINELKANNLFGSGAGPSDDNSFIQDHLVGDVLGLGDLRLSAAYKFWEQDTFLLTLGTQITIPTSTVTRGLYGRNFRKISEPAFLNLENFFCNFAEASKPGTPADLKAAINADLDQQKKEFGIRVLDWLSANLLVPPIGQEQQWALGWFIEPQLHIQERITLKTRFCFDYLFGHHRTNFILVNRNLEGLSTAIFDTVNPDTAVEITEEEASNRLAYISELIQEKFGPNQANSQLSGRAKVQLTIAPEFRVTDNWTILFGYDFWWLQSEKIEQSNDSYLDRYEIQATPLPPDSPNPPRDFITTFEGAFPLGKEIYKAERSSAYQHKLVGAVNYKRFTRKHDLTFSLGGDITVGSHGIGKDFTLMTGLTLHF